ncbi:3367_t:CDS:2, partial [Racocetra fulgida]
MPIRNKRAKKVRIKQQRENYSRAKLLTNQQTRRQKKEATLRVQQAKQAS